MDDLTLTFFATCVSSLLWLKGHKNVCLDRNQMPEGANFCNSCGIPGQATVVQKGGLSLGKLLLIGGIGFFVLILIIAVIGSMAGSSGPAPSSVSQNTQPTQASPPEPLLNLTLSGSGSKETRSFLLKPGLVGFSYVVSDNDDTMGDSSVPANFAVELLDSSGNHVGLIVNEIEETGSGSQGIHSSCPTQYSRS